MILLGISAAASFLLALVLGASALLAPVAAFHVAFALGVLPLIFGAMLHFVPVLTRSASPHRFIASLPFVAQAVGLFVVLALQGWLPRWVLHPAACADLLAALVLLVWMVRRARRALGSPHPGWRWYMASLAMLVLALVSVPLLTAGVMPLALRNFHLHANTLGFVGLAALGTLPVLMPTVLARPDPQAANWLREHWLLALSGVLLLATGSAFYWPLAVIGAVMLLMAAGLLLLHWRKCFGLAALWADGAAAPLAAALIAYLLLVLAGILHASGEGGGSVLVPAFAAGFLLPLVTGALSQLLPVWRFAGPQTPARGEMRARLVRFGRWRAMAFPTAGLAFAFGLYPLNLMLAGLGLLLFLADLIFALRVKSLPR